MRDDDEVIPKLRRMSLKLSGVIAQLDKSDERFHAFRATRERIDAAIAEMLANPRSAQRVSVRITAETFGLARAIKEIEASRMGSSPDAFPVG